MAQLTYKRYCKDCRAIGQCKARYNKYWADRSGGGVGCPNPMEEPPLPGKTPRRPAAWDDRWF